MSLLYPALTIIPDFGDPPRYIIGSDIAKNSGAPAETFATFPQTEPHRLFGFRFVLDTAAEINAMKAFFTERGGRARPFYLPSWRDDLTFASISEAGDFLVLTLSSPSNPLTSEHGSDARRTLFFYQDGNLHVTRWVTAAEAGDSLEVTLETPVPFDLTAGVVMVGFAHLVTFSDDAIAWKHQYPDAASATITFRESRQWSTLPAADAITAEPFNDFPGFIRAAAAEDALTPVDFRVAYARGPATWGIPGNPVDRWAAWVHTDGTLHVLKTNYDIARPDASGIESGIEGPFGDRIAIAFDMDGNEAVATVNDSGQIILKWWNVTIQELTFSGRDPVLANTYFNGGTAAAPEVVIFYLKTGNTLFARFQSDDFATERIVAILPFKPLELRGLAQLDGMTVVFADTSWRLVTLTLADP